MAKWPFSIKNAKMMRTCLSSQMAISDVHSTVHTQTQTQTESEAFKTHEEESVWIRFV